MHIIAPNQNQSSKTSYLKELVYGALLIAALYLN